MSASILFGLFSSVFLLGGVELSIWGIRTLKLAQASKKWPSTTGTITFAEVTEETKSERNSKTGQTRVRTTYRPNLKFEYVVGGSRYSSTQRVVGDTHSGGSRNTAYAMIQKYPEGRTVPVYYDPSGPQDAVLETGVNGATFTLLFAGILLTLMGSLMLFGFARTLGGA